LQLQKIDLHSHQGPWPAILGVCLAALGMLGLILVFLLLQRVRADQGIGILIALAAIGAIVGGWLHQRYHRLILKIIAWGKVVETREMETPWEILRLKRWEAVAVKLAPTLDLTLLAFLGTWLLPALILPVAVSFAASNLWLSGQDALDAMRMLKLTDKHQEISWTPKGFVIWEEK